MPLRRTLLLHLAPGATIVIFYIVTSPLLVQIGFPRTAALLLAFLLVGMPLQLLILRKQSVRFREPMPSWLFAVLVIGLFGVALAIVLFVPMSPISDYLATRVFFWAPPSILPAPDHGPQPARTLLLVFLGAQLIIDGIAHPIVEEFYSRLSSSESRAIPLVRSGRQHGALHVRPLLAAVQLRLDFRDGAAADVRHMVAAQLLRADGHPLPGEHARSVDLVVRFLSQLTV